MHTYLLAITPPEDIQNIVDSYRKKYSVYSNYKIPPHITIYQPFYSYILEDEIISILRSTNIGSPSKVSFDNIGFFEDKNKVVYFKPNKESYSVFEEYYNNVSTALFGKIKNKYTDYADSYVPHMTIADEIPEDIFEQIKTELKELNESLVFQVNSIDLYKQTPESNVWVPVESISLKML